MTRRLVRALAGPAGSFALFAAMLLVLAALAPQALAPSNPLQIQPGTSLRPPDRLHLLGTDLLGRDVLSQMIYGTRTALVVGSLAVALSLVAGTLTGLISGFWGASLVDEFLMRLIDALYAVPDIILALTIVAILGPEHIWSIIVALALGRVPAYARLVRGRVLALREADFVVAARSTGATTQRILLRHVLPQTVDVIVARSVIGLSGIVLGEATLSFLGLGIQPPTPSWGRMLREGFEYLSRAPWVALPPGFAIFLTVFAFNQVGEAVHDALDPRVTQGARS